MATNKAKEQMEADKVAYQQARYGSQKEWVEVDHSIGDNDSDSISPSTVRQNEEKALTIVGLRFEDALLIYSDGVREVMKDGKSVQNSEDDYVPSRANVETFGGEVIRIVYWG